MKKLSFIIIYLLLFSLGCSQKSSSKGQKIDQTIQHSENYKNQPSQKGKSIQNIEPTWESMAENYQVPQWFQDGKIGVWMHWGVPSSIDENRPHDGSHYGRWMYGSEEMRPPARNPNQVKAVERLSKWHIDNYGPLEEYGYEKFIPNFKAENFNAETIVEFAKECGAKFIMPVATHHDNFDMYDSSFPWNAVKMGPKRDIIQEWKDAAYKHDLKFGVSTHLYWSPKFFNSSRKYQTPNTPEWDLFNMDYDSENYDSQDSWNEHWYERCWELIDKYDPDLFNNDSPYPSIKTGKSIGLKLFSNFLNKDLKENNGQQTTVLSFKDSKKDKAAFTYNLERGMFGEIQEHPWMWATDLSGSWFYRKGAFTRMSTPVFLGNAMDAISKNGVVMINLALKGDGTLPDNQAKMMREFGDFVKTNSEGIYGTRPWKTYGEGPLEIISKRAGENLREFSAADIRFTTKGDDLYAFVLAVPTQDITITTLKENGLLEKNIKQITLMGSQEKITWTRNETGLTIQLPKDLPNHPVIGFKIELELESQMKVITNSAIYPTFSWDKMPLYMHLRKLESFSDAELEYLARFPLITLEKTTGSRTHGGTEKGSMAAAKAIKKVNPNTKILYYRNCVINWHAYPEDEAFIKKNPDVLLKNSLGEYATMNNSSTGTKFFDISKEKVRDYWLDNAIKYANNPYIDGIFVDANYKVLTSYMKNKKVAEAKRDELKTGYYDMMETLQKEIGEEKLIISNLLRVRPEQELENGRKMLPYVHGSYIETFENDAFGLSYEDYLAQGIETVQQSAREGNIIAFTLGLGEALEFETEGMDDRRAAVNLDENLKERIDYLLAIFLVCAEKYSYIYLHDGFDVNTRKKTGKNASKVWMKSFPQYENRLGSPKGLAKRDGYIYTRSFEYLDVWLDVKNQKARLDWK